MLDFAFRYYMLAIMIGPCLFYVPKFFELRSVQTRLPIDLSVDCETVLNPPKINFTLFKGKNFTNRKQELTLFDMLAKTLLSFKSITWLMCVTAILRNFLFLERRLDLLSTCIQQIISLKKGEATLKFSTLNWKAR